MRIMFVGDINLGEYYTSFGHGPLSFLKNNNVFENVQNLFDMADCVVGNLEAGLTNHKLNLNEPESVVLRGDPSSSSILKKAGFKFLQVANNHTVQHGKDGFDETIQSLLGQGIVPIGQNNQDLATIEISGKRVGFLAASDVPDNTDKNQSCYQAITDDFLEKVTKSVDAVDYLFVLFHWGLEASTQPMEYQRSLTTKLVNLGVKGIIGSHPHLFYEVWLEQNAVAAPSLGDFIFDLGWDKRLLNSGILDIEIIDEKLKVQIWPVELKENGCLPTLSGKAVEVTNSVIIHDNGENMKGEEIRKLYYFFTNLHKGNFLLKFKFISRKFFPFLKPKKIEETPNG